MSQFQPRTPSAAASPPGEVPQRKQPANVPVRIFATCLTSVIVAVHYTNYGPLIPTLIGDLHITGGQAGLLSTFLFLGLAVMYIPAGALADRYGQRPVLIASSILLVIGAILLPLSPNFFWILVCRFVVGLGSGAAFVAGAGVASNLGKYSSLGQGMYGGSVQIGSGLGRLLPPPLLTPFCWGGPFFILGLICISSLITLLFFDYCQSAHNNSNINI